MILYFKKYKGNRKTINNIPENYDILKFNSYFPTIIEEKLKEVIENNKINDTARYISKERYVIR